MTINLNKVKNKQIIKKIQKLKDFSSNSYSYLQVVFFQCVIQEHSLEQNPNLQQIEIFVQGAVSDSNQGLVRANSLKMVYAMLRDNKNLYPKIQERLLKKFVEMQTLKLRKNIQSKENQTLSDQIEAHNELLAAYKELIELTTVHTDKYALLT